MVFGAAPLAGSRLQRSLARGGRCARGNLIEGPRARARYMHMPCTCIRLILLTVVGKSRGVDILSTRLELVDKLCQLWKGPPVQEAVLVDKLSQLGKDQVQRSCARPYYYYAYGDRRPVAREESTREVRDQVQESSGSGFGVRDVSSWGPCEVRSFVLSVPCVPEGRTGSGSESARRAALTRWRAFRTLRRTRRA